VTAPDVPDVDLTAAPTAVQFASASAIAYATAPNSELYRPVMRLFHENRQEYGPHLSPGDVADRLRVGYGIERDLDQLDLDLKQLMQWGALEGRQDNPRVRTASELVRRQFIYDITPAGEECERFLERLGRLRAQAGSLQGQRLPTILTELKRMARELDLPEPSPVQLQEALTNLTAALEELRQGALDFMRDLANVMHSSDALDVESFTVYKNQVIDYLIGFRAELESTGGDIRDAIGEVEVRGTERLIDLVASQQEAPVFDVDPAEVRRRAAEQPRRAWAGVRSWFVAGKDGRPHFELLDSKLYDAIGWILHAVQRLKERTSQRIDRSTEYRHLSQLFHDAPADEDAHALFAAAFGLYASRHFTCPLEPADAECIPVQRSFWEAPVAPIETRLRNPNRKTTGVGRGSRVGDNAMAQELLRRQRAVEREELEQALATFTGKPQVRLSDVVRLSEVEFRHLLAWLGRALERPAKNGQRRAESVDGLLVISLFDPAGEYGLVSLRTPVGTFMTPDYVLDVERT
jgi:uncharacterized protein (TIGR02677 family)